jgi:RNA polymerase sigma-70 factor (ECF subfamily)
MHKHFRVSPNNKHKSGESDMIANIQEVTSAAATSPVPTRQSSPIGNDTSDEVLIQRVALGDTSAMRVLYTRHSSCVYGFILRVVDNKAVVEELVNEVFLDVWRGASKFEGRSRVSSWLLAVARHKALTLLRRRSTEPLQDDAHELIEDASDDPETAVQRKQKSAILLKCLAMLSPAHREIINLVYYHDKTINDAASIVGIARNTVKTRMFYARKQLMALLGAEGIVTALA